MQKVTWPSDSLVLDGRAETLFRDHCHSIAQSKQAMHHIALRQTPLEATNASVEATAVAHTAELKTSELRAREMQERYQGLAIAHAIIVEKHGGTIHFETEMGKGTTFIVRLPLHTQSTKLPENTYNEEDPSVSLAA